MVSVFKLISFLRIVIIVQICTVVNELFHMLYCCVEMLCLLTCGLNGRVVNLYL